TRSICCTAQERGFLKGTALLKRVAVRLRRPYEMVELARFQEGEAGGNFPSITRWVERVRRGVRAGKRFHRVHMMVTEPLSDYVRFECAWAYRHTVAAGEDVRIIAVPEGQ